MSDETEQEPEKRKGDCLTPAAAMALLVVLALVRLAIWMVA
jgi:hypothetical protein